jgi:hypothetical protein
MVKRIAITQDAIKEAPAYWAGALSLWGEETPKEGKRQIAHFKRWRNYACG